MKKEKTEQTAKKNKFLTALKEKLKSLIVPFAFLLVVGIAAVTLILLTKDEEEEEKISIHRYEGTDKEIQMENDQLKFVMDPSTTHFSVTDKSSGAVWYSNPDADDIDADPIALTSNKDNLNATLLLTYSTDKALDTLLDNYKYSISEQVYEIEAADDYIKVMYSIGRVQKEFIIPQVISVARMEELTADMDKSVTRLIRDYYVKYDINNLKATDNKEELLEKYPLLAETPLYVLRDNVGDNVKTRFEPAFLEAGYTEEEYREELELYSIESTNNNPVFNINVIYRLDGGDLVVEVPMQEMEYKKDYPIYTLAVLPYFGAGGTSEDGYLLVPEGGGSLINFNNGKNSLNSYYTNVYGWDMAQSRDYLVHETRAYFGVFGIAKGGRSFICILEDGSSYASINADISGRYHSFNYVNATYNVMHRDTADIGTRLSYSLYQYELGLQNESLVERYRFVDTDDYVDMANAYHDYLAEKYGDGFAKNDDTSVPVAVEIVGAVDKVRQVLGVPVSRPLAVTTYKEARAIIEELNDSGVGNLSVKLSGWMNGGVRQKILKNVNLISSLGSKKDFKALLKYASDNGIDLYLDGVTNYAYKSNIFNGFITFRDAATFANKKRVKLRPFNVVDFAEEEWMDTYYLLKPSVILDMADNLTDAAKDYGAAGVSFADIGYQLSADYSQKNHVSREEALNQQVEKLNEIHDSGLRIMTNMGNDYTLGVTDQIVNMDLSGSEYSIVDKIVPFYQIAIHGHVNYTGQPLNLVENYEEELLRSVEYGAGLYVTFMDASVMKLQNTYYTQYFGANYDSWKDRFIDIYTRYEGELGSTFNQRIVGHRILNDGVTLTSYEDGTRVYVNYRYEDYTTDDGIVLPARDYLVK